jgi:hypothetical protein
MTTTGYQVIPLQASTGPLGSRRLRQPKFPDNWHMKVVRLSALHNGCLYHPGDIPGTHFCQRLSQPQGHRVAERIKSMKNPTNPIRNQTRDLLACSTVPQPTALP